MRCIAASGDAVGQHLCQQTACGGQDEARAAADLSVDVFGRGKVADARDNRLGAGSFERDCRTLYVNYSGAISHMQTGLQVTLGVCGLANLPALGVFSGFWCCSAGAVSSLLSYLHHWQSGSDGGSWVTGKAAFRARFCGVGSSGAGSHGARQAAGIHYLCAALQVLQTLMLLCGVLPDRVFRSMANSPPFGCAKCDILQLGSLMSRPPARLTRRRLPFVSLGLLHKWSRLLGHA